jgi:multidrug efflux pump subunit AcrB
MRRDLAALRALKIQTASGGTVPLATVADIDYSEGVSSIKRNNRNRVVSIGSDLPQGVALDTASARFREIVKDANIPPTVSLSKAATPRCRRKCSRASSTPC